MAKIINEQAGLEITKVIPIKRIPKTTSGKLQCTTLGKAYLDGEFEGVLTKLHDLTQLESSRDDVSGMTLTEIEVSQICVELLQLNGKKVEVK